MLTNRSVRIPAVAALLAVCLATSGVAEAARKTTKKTTKKVAAKTTTTMAAPTTAAAPATTAAPVTTAAAPAAAPAPKCNGLKTVRIGNFGQNSTTIMFDYAEMKGLFEKYCVKFVRSTPIFNPNLIVQSMDQGQSDMAFVGTAGVLNAIAAKRDVVIVANASVGFPLEIDLSDNQLRRFSTRKITPNSPYQTKLEYLRGLTFALPPIGSTIDVVFRYLLKTHGMDPDKDVTLRGISDYLAISAAVKQDAVDGMIGLGTATSVQAAVEGWAKPFINAGVEDPIVRNMPLYVLATSRAFIKSNPEAVEGVLRAMQESRQAMKAKYSDADVAKLKSIIAPDMSDSIWAAAVKYAYTHLTGGEMKPTPAELKVMLEIFNATAATPVNPTFDQVYDTSIVSKIG